MRVAVHVDEVAEVARWAEGIERVHECIWMAREGVVVAQLPMGAVRKGAGGRAAGRGRD